jgi:hypothetical protein
VTPGFHSVSNKSEWNRGSPIPVIFSNDTGFKKMTVVLLIKTDGGRAAILERCSQILSRLLEPADMALDGFTHKFYGILSSYSHDEKVMKRWHTLTLVFDCYEYGAEAVSSFSGQMEMSVRNAGNILTPVIIEITPKTGAASITLTGVCRDPDTGEDLPVEIRELSTGQTVTLDGETGLITQDGEQKAKDVDIWTLPVLLPGDNLITVNNNRMDLKVRFRPRFM